MTGTYKNIIKTLEEEKENINKAIAELTEAGWSGEAKDKFMEKHIKNREFYTNLIEDIKYLKNALENEEKPRAIRLKKQSEDFKKQMTAMMLWVSVYAVVYAVFINPIYGILQLFVALTIPLLKMYNGERGTWKGMKWFFYVYYPLHLVICGLIRIVLHGNVGVMIGG